MNMLRSILAYCAAVCIIAAGGCEDRFNLGVLPNPGQSTVIGDTNYVEVFPPYGGFESPRAMTVGNDQLLYITDYARNQLVMMDAAGRILHTKSIIHPISVVQNSKLDLYVGGRSSRRTASTLSVLFSEFFLSGLTRITFPVSIRSSIPPRGIRRSPLSSATPPFFQTMTCQTHTHASSGRSRAAHSGDTRE